MINPRELRIGNYYICSDDNEIVSVNDAYSLYLIQENKNALPIPLTDEWLLKFGATEEMSGHFLLDRFKIIWKESYKYWYVIDRYNGCYYSKVEFVHEFQNFVFILNGKEL